MGSESVGFTLVGGRGYSRAAICSWRAYIGGGAHSRVSGIGPDRGGNPGRLPGGDARRYRGTAKLRQPGDGRSAGHSYNPTAAAAGGVIQIKQRS